MAKKQCEKELRWDKRPVHGASFRGIPPSQHTRMVLDEGARASRSLTYPRRHNSFPIPRQHPYSLRSRQPLERRVHSEYSHTDLSGKDRFHPPWKEVKELGRGGFGVVMEIRDRKGKEFALKKLNKLNKLTFDSAMREIRSLSILEHENIVEFICAFKTESEVCIVMELMVAGSVKKYMKKNGGSLTESEARSFTKDSLRGLIYLHNKEIIHRDIKCDNILVDANNMAKLADMGIAKIHYGEEINYSNVSSYIAGSPWWQAPEVCQGKPPGRKSDVWMMGITVWEMIEGKPPLRGYSSSEVLSVIGTKPGIHLKTLKKSHMSTNLKEFLKKIFAERPYAFDIACMSWLTA